MNSKQNKGKKTALVHLLILAPGHFHAALLQKTMNEDVSPVVHVFAPEGTEVKSYENLIAGYNTRKKDPTSWKEIIYTGDDYLQKMLTSKPGNVVVIAGNNRYKTDYIEKSVQAGLHVLADKPLVISKAGFEKLKDIFKEAEEKGVLVYDIMTERFAVTNVLQRIFGQMPEVFGELEKGSLENPAIISHSIHHFYKHVSGSPIVRPAWYFDVEQAGEGLVDITTHMIDLIQWGCFPNQKIDYRKDVVMLDASRWPTPITLPEFKKVTQKEAFPSYLYEDIKNNTLHVYANGEMNYKIKGVNTKVSVVWNYEAPQGSGDSFMSIRRGTKAHLIIKQGKEQEFKPVLYIKPILEDEKSSWEESLKLAIRSLQKDYPGVEVKESGKEWQVIIPPQYRKDHETHFAEVVKAYIHYLKEKRLPEFEIENILAKYYTTTAALEKALER